jgi:bifunctional non-homologous end joining protein LigD
VSAAYLQKRLKPLNRKTQLCVKLIAHKRVWVEPKLLAEIEYRAKSAEDKVRHPFFKGRGITYKVKRRQAVRAISVAKPR